MNASTFYKFRTYQADFRGWDNEKSQKQTCYSLQKLVTLCKPHDSDELMQFLAESDLLCKRVHKISSFYNHPRLEDQDHSLYAMATIQVHNLTIWTVEASLLELYVF